MSADELRDAAEDWWRGHRPVGWSEKEHLLNPAINCCGSDEARLAHAVAEVVAGEGKP